MTLNIAILYTGEIRTIKNGTNLLLRKVQKKGLPSPFLKVEKIDYHDPNAPPPSTELAAIGSINPSAIPGVAAPGIGVLSC